MSLAHAILAVLSDQPMHGYAVRTALGELMGSFWPVNQGQVYASLDRLVRDGLVTRSEPRPSGATEAVRIHTIADRGRHALRGWLDDPGAPGRNDGLEFDDWLARLAVCERHGDAALARAILDVQRRRCQALRHALGPRRTLPATAAARAADALLEAELGWLDVVERDLGAASPTTARRA